MPAQTFMSRFFTPQAGSAATQQPSPDAGEASKKKRKPPATQHSSGKKAKKPATEDKEVHNLVESPVHAPVECADEGLGPESLGPETTKLSKTGCESLELPEIYLDEERHRSTMKMVHRASRKVEADSKSSTPGAAAKYTPMEKQVVTLKARHPGALLAIECGYRFRFFGDDATAAAEVTTSSQ
jgi:hypothetical protein